MYFNSICCFYISILQFFYLYPCFNNYFINFENISCYTNIDHKKIQIFSKSYFKYIIKIIQILRNNSFKSYSCL